MNLPIFLQFLDNVQQHKECWLQHLSQVWLHQQKLFQELNFTKININKKLEIKFKIQKFKIFKLQRIQTEFKLQNYQSILHPMIVFVHQWTFLDLQLATTIQRRLRLLAQATSKAQLAQRRLSSWLRPCRACRATASKRRSSESSCSHCPPTSATSWRRRAHFQPLGCDEACGTKSENDRSRKRQDLSATKWCSHQLENKL